MERQRYYANRKRLRAKPAYKGSARQRNMRQRNRNSATWSKAFLLKIAACEARVWQHRVAAGEL